MKFKVAKKEEIVSSSVWPLMGVLYSMKGFLGGLIYLIVLGLNETGMF